MAKSQKHRYSNTTLFLAALVVLAVGAFLVGPKLTGYVLATSALSSDSNYVEMYLRPGANFSVNVGNTGYSIIATDAFYTTSPRASSSCRLEISGRVNQTPPTDSFGTVTISVLAKVSDQTKPSTLPLINGFRLYYHVDQVTAPAGTPVVGGCRVSAFVAS